MLAPTIASMTLRYPLSLTRRSSVAPAKAGAHLSNVVLKLALLTKAFATLSWIPACAGMTSFWLMLAPYHRKYDAEVSPSGYRIAHAKFERRPCGGRGPYQQRSIKISAANKSIRYAHVDTCLRRYDLVLADACPYHRKYDAEASP
jgi:hypothetical protein